MPKKLAPRLALVAIITTVVALSSLAAYGYVFGFDDPRATADPTTAAPRTVAAPQTGSTTAAPTTATSQPPPTTTRPVMAQPAAVVMPAGRWVEGMSGPAVLAYERRLAALRFDPGPVDGRFDQATRYAVEAVQKLYGLARTGAIDEDVRRVVGAFRWPEPLARGPNVEPDRVELDLDRQVIIVYQGWKLRLITATSTGTGKRFCGGDDGCDWAVTPAGKYAFTRYVNGWRTSKLGRLYKPWYFNGGIAIHGFATVPRYPASHGCARIPMHIAEYFGSLVRLGEPVYVVGTPAPRGGYTSGPNVAGSGASSSGNASGASTPTTHPPAVTPTTAATTTTARPPITTTPPTTRPSTTLPPTTRPPTTIPPTTAPPTAPTAAP